MELSERIKYLVINGGQQIIDFLELLPSYLFKELLQFGMMWFEESLIYRRIIDCYVVLQSVIQVIHMQILLRQTELAQKK
jgi:hypothetical protein